MAAMHRRRRSFSRRPPISRRLPLCPLPRQQPRATKALTLGPVIEAERPQRRWQPTGAFAAAQVAAGDRPRFRTTGKCRIFCAKASSATSRKVDTGFECRPPDAGQPGSVARGETAICDSGNRSTASKRCHTVSKPCREPAGSRVSGYNTPFGETAERRVIVAGFVRRTDPLVAGGPTDPRDRNRPNPPLRHGKEARSCSSQVPSREPARILCFTSALMIVCLVGLVSCSSPRPTVRSRSVDADEGWPKPHQPWQETRVVPASWSERTQFWSPASLDNAPGRLAPGRRSGIRRGWTNSARPATRPMCGPSRITSIANKTARAATERPVGIWRIGGRKADSILSFRSPEVGSRTGRILSPAERSEICLQCHEDAERNPGSPCGPGGHVANIGPCSRAGCPARTATEPTTTSHRALPRSTV